ncbi:MAG: hypothetical protein HOA17_01180 [Candidatus Melainabacteria bacterium]|jgi:hypothetical protein|nr:hypothetical protein [Candidatus Melainabacteria bacterium]
MDFAALPAPKLNLVTSTRELFTAYNGAIDQALRSMKTPSADLGNFHSAIVTLKSKLKDADPQETNYPHDDTAKQNQLFASVLRTIADLIDKGSSLTTRISNKFNQAMQDFVNHSDEYTPFLRLLESFLLTLTEEFDENGLPK